MAIFSTLRRWWGAGGATRQEPGPQDFRPITRAHDSSPDYGIDGAMQVSAVWAAVELLADNIASLPLFVYETAGGEKALARGSQLYRLLHDAPNSRHTPYEFWQFMLLNYVLRGNAYARLERNSADEVVAMWPLAADQVEVEALKDGSLVYKYTTGGTVAVYGEAAILHLREKGNGIVGMSRLEYMRASINVAVQAQNHTGSLYAKGARRPGTFMIDRTLTKEQRHQIRENFRGLTERGDDDLLVLEAGAKFEPLSLSPADMQLLETRRFSVEDIARWFGLPSVLINDTAKTTTWGTGIGQIVEGFYKFRLRPMLVGFEQAIRARVLTDAQRVRYTAEFSLEALLRSNLKDRMEIYSQAVQNGIFDRNECRQLENLPPRTGGDMLTAQVNLAPLDKLGAVVEA